MLTLHVSEVQSLSAFHLAPQQRETTLTLMMKLRQTLLHEDLTSVQSQTTAIMDALPKATARQSSCS